jgi:phosphatidylglycerol lysyltransferase
LNAVLPPDPKASPAAIERALEAVRRYGYNVTSFQVLEPGFQYWFPAAGEGCVAYVDTGSAWVAAGAPLGPVPQLDELAREFVADAARSGKRACFFATEERFGRAGEAAGLRALCIGQQPIWDPRRWADSLRSSRSLREQLRRARAKGVVIRQLEPEELADPQARVRLQVERLFAAWLDARQMAPMGFLVQLHAFSHFEERRCFVALAGDRLIGFLGMVPVYGRAGWFIEDFLREPGAPNGTSELLIDSAMATAAREGAAFVTLGLAPLAGPVRPTLRWLARLSSALYDFEGLRAFKAKLQPERWDPVFLSFPRASNSWVALYDSLNAFARGDLLDFGIETLLRGPALVVRVLAVLLVPWTALLMAADAEHWFPAQWIKWAWVAFDVGIATALLRLSRDWVEPLGSALAVAVTLDAALTVIEALLFNVPRIRSPGEACVTALAVLAPGLAALVLWRARLRRRSLAGDR